MANVKFGRGSKAMNAVDQNMVYFNTTTQEIYMGGKSFGFSAAAKADLDAVLAGLRTDLNGAINGVAYNKADGKFTFSFVDADQAVKEVTIDVATASSTNPGLMSQEHVNLLTEAVADLAALMGEGGSIAADIEAAVAAEAALREAEDGKLSKAITDEVARAEAAEKVNADAIAAEKTRAEKKEGEIEAAMGEETARVDKKIADDIKAESDLRVAAEQEIAASVVTEKERALAAEKTLSDNLAAAEERINQKITGDIAAESAKRVEAEGALQDAIDAEAATARAAEKKLGEDLTAAIAQEVSDRDAAILVETNRAKGVEEGLRTDLDNHVADTVSHITADERTAWNAAKTSIDAFLADADMSENAVDTLKELQSYMTGDGEAATQLVNRVAANEAAIEKLNGEATVEGSVKKAVADEAKRVDDAMAAEQAVRVAAEAQVLTDAKKYTDDKVAAEVSRVDEKIAADILVETNRAKAAEEANAAAIALLNNTGETEGSVAHSVAVGVAEAKSHAETKIEEALTWYEDEAEGEEA